MKKTLSIIALSVIGLGLVSCKKEAKETTGSEMMTADSTAAPAMDSLAAPVVEGDSAATPVSTEPSTTIALSESNFDFGAIKKGDKVEHVYEVTNTGKNPLVISAVTPGCGCTAGDFTKEPILPGKKGKVTLHFDSTNFDGAINKTADVFANVEKAPIKLSFTGNVQP